MPGEDNSISRRKFLEQAGGAVGAVALGAACSSEDGENVDPNGAAGSAPGEAGSSAGAPSGSAGSAGQASGGSGAGGSSAGTGGRAAAAGNGGASGAGAGAEPPAAGSGEAGAAGEPAAAAGAAAPAPTGKAVVAIVAIMSKPSLDEVVARAVELAGGLGAIQAGQTVFIKPNAVSDRMVGTPGIRTSNEVLAAVVRLVKARDPGRIIVGDRSARSFPDTVRVFEVSGMRQAALEAGADEVYAASSPEDAPDEWLLVQPPKYEETWMAAGGILAMRKILEADHLINVPTLKNHRYALFSLSMKNFMGAIGDSSRDPVHFLSSTSGNFVPIGRDIAILNQPFKPLMNIVDGTVALVNGGPQGDGADAVRTSTGVILASSDRIALDATGASLIQLELETATVPTPDAANPILKSERAWMLPQIQNAIELGLGVASAADVTLMFDGVASSAGIEAKFRA